MALLNYPGAKWGMADDIISIMPAHRTYVEPFFGSGAVFFKKLPSAIETINDIDGEVVNFFRVMRERPQELARLIALTPYARDVFDDAHGNQCADELDRAYRFAIRSRMGHGYKTYAKTGFKVDVYARERSYCVNCWNSMPDDIIYYAQRLKEAQIENLPAIDLIARYNHENVLIYADPPYMMSTRGAKMYKHEMSETDHAELLDALIAHKGSVILSGYDSPLYADKLKKWSKITKKSYNQNGDRRTECLWCNYPVQTRLTEVIE